MTADAVARWWIVGAHRAPLQLLSSRDYPADPRRKSPPRDQLAVGYFAAPCEITVPDGDCNRNMMAPIPIVSVSRLQSMEDGFERNSKVAVDCGGNHCGFESDRRTCRRAGRGQQHAQCRSIDDRAWSALLRTSDWAGG